LRRESREKKVGIRPTWTGEKRREGKEHLKDISPQMFLPELKAVGGPTLEKKILNLEQRKGPLVKTQKKKGEGIKI